MRDYALIVSGHPRSGTSLAMQMLFAGGIDVVAEDRRDAFNPNGYFEIPIDGIPGVKPGIERLMEHCRGKAAKVTAVSLHLLKNTKVPLKIIYMERDSAACAKSFARLNEARGTRIIPQNVVEYFTDLGRSTAMKLTDSVLWLKYENIISDPMIAASCISDFVGKPFDIEAAASAVKDPKCQEITKLLK